MVVVPVVVFPGVVVAGVVALEQYCNLAAK